MRAARPGDAGAITDLVQRAFAHYVPRIGARPGPMDDDYAARIERGEAFVRGEPLAGVLVLRPELDHSWLDLVAVDPALQGSGLGGELVAFAETRTRELGLGEIRLLTHELMTENLGLYAHLGYREYDRRTDHGFSRVFLRKILHPSNEQRATRRMNTRVQPMPQPLIDRYRDRLSLEPSDPVVSLREGATPLVEAPVISERVGARVLLKLEGANPTGSFKDRGMTVAVSRAKGAGAEAVICASTGNTAASAAAYAARAGMRGVVIVPEGKIATGKLAQALIHGARVVALRGNFDQALEIVRALAERHPVELVNSVNPYRIDGQKTAAFEVVEELGEPPDALAIPVGNAGNVTAWWRGFSELEAAPLLYGFQAEGAAPLVRGAPVAEPETVASAIRIGNPARWEEAMDAFTSSRGRVEAVSDGQILDAYRLLASREGVYCEPASAAAVAGLLGHGLPVPEGAPPPETIVCALTGHGLKDPETALGTAPAVIACEADLDAVERVILD